MPALRVLSLVFCLCGAALVQGAEPETKLYEQRIYYTHPGRLEALNARFRDHTVKLFEKHGMTNLGYFVPTENPDGLLVYFLAFPSREARDKSFKEFGADPAWQKARAESEAAGPIVKKVESHFLTAVEGAPTLRPASDLGTFELRTYTATAGNLDKLSDRFRDHTIKLLEKHGVKTLGLWKVIGDSKDGGKVVCLVTHKSPAAARESYEAFRKDPEWLAAKKASEEAAGGSLTSKEIAVSVFLTPTDYSTVK